MPNQTSSDELHRELRKLRTRSKLLPKLGGAGGILGGVALSATAFLAGWEIGTAARSIWVHESIPADPSDEVTGVALRDKGDDVVGMAVPASYMPYDGWVATKQDPAQKITYYVTNCNGTTSTILLAKFLFHDAVVGTSCGGLKARYFLNPVTIKPPQTSKEDGAIKLGNRLEWPTGTAGTNGESTTTTEQRVRDELTSKESEYPTLVAWLDNRLGGGSADPTGQRIAVPSCAGLVIATCAAKLESAGLVPERSTLTPAQADLEKPAGAVISTTPASGSQVDTGSKVVVLTNPDAMPFKMPAPAVGETYDAFIARLQALGFVGTATKVVLTDATLDPTRGPDAVTTTAPATGGRVLLDSTITVRVNPATAPVVPGAGSPDKPGLPAIDFGPLQATTPCDVFPFGLPCWAIETMAVWVVGNIQAPSFALPFPFVAEADYPRVDLAIFDPHAPLLRGLILLLSAMSMAFLFYSLATGRSSGSGGDD